ncbi:MAG: hypothetical protein VX569_07680 [Pseudomonadota bacterium]|nr:hypothetical protein [Pseudomonadota bacterium]
MSFWTAAVVIVAIWGIVQVMSARRERGPGRDRPADGAEAGDAIGAGAADAETRREIEDLRERIRVLEKITVDGREARAIADEIERLRDK